MPCPASVGGGVSSGQARRVTFGRRGSPGAGGCGSGGVRICPPFHPHPLPEHSAEPAPRRVVVSIGVLAASWPMSQIVPTDVKEGGRYGRFGPDRSRGTVTTGKGTRGPRHRDARAVAMRHASCPQLTASSEG